MNETDTAIPADIEALFTRYLGAFNAGDFDAAFDCYRVPFTWFFGRNAVTVMDREQFVAMMTQTKNDLAAAGLEGSRPVRLEVRALGSRAALLGTEIVRYRADGSEIKRLAGTYLVHHDGIQWSFVANVMHDAESLIEAA